MKDEIKFEKVSLEQFSEDCKKIFGKMLSDTQIQKAYDLITLPKRGTSGSAGYDFVTPFGFKLYCDNVNSSQIIPTGIRVKLPKDLCLLIMPRSGLGFKSGMYLANTVGVIDSDYYYATNSGHIMMKFIAGFKDVAVDAGARVAQGIIMKYYTTSDDNAEETRTGGFGSTGAN